ncbi:MULTISPECIES: response regulator transcription factor [unclassified Undibacterium]|uniref:response regulator transcription factor n=1 Tax=unclassified Undibacterium TaxID=2630295 RepID=UPI002AC99600|nr:MULTISPECIES: response regulator transcription factor [unclassified Undibacterium]MEB0138319.1 response regulator transcription factor [Undibacterium sp. CCC2.1]MEB0172696.1 response regulator transcription factor [Undibacterium sp. CCC1.1]MEB0174694.1 response regulator transcription factor [Undibacterium sp. CCC3.4]MEB0213891.1 response regulator transcription factor [Undibacterium sp. 5I2]WPX42617.1 response regulator transcription factor [Undibacterium sp. CCC3.4]
MHILLVEDDTVLAEGVSHMLREQGMLVDVVHTGRDAVFHATHQKYSVLVLDLGLPDIDGFEVLRQVRRHGAIPVLLLTARDAILDRVQGFELGADDYLVKPFSTLELVARLKALVRRSAPVAAEIRLGQLTLDPASKRVCVNAQPIDLSVREWTLLEYLLKQESRVVSKQQIIDAILQHGEDLSVNAIEVYVSRLRIKLHQAGVIIRTIRGFGYMLEEQQ